MTRPQPEAEGSPTAGRGEAAADGSAAADSPAADGRHDRPAAAGRADEAVELGKHPHEQLSDDRDTDEHPRIEGDEDPADVADDEADEDDEDDEDRPKKRSSMWRELPVLILVALVLALLLKAFVVQAFYIPSGSMEKTLLIRDRVLVNKVSYHFRDVHRGEIVVFNGKGTSFPQESVIAEPTNPVQKALRGLQRLLGLGAPGERDYIKRVIAVGGDTVACCDPQGRVTVNGTPLNEPYVFEDDSSVQDQKFGPVKVPKGQLFVMGDHRNNSSDSRVNGTIGEDRVIGRAFVRVWPVSRFGTLPVPKTFSTVHNASSGGLGVPAPLPPAAVAVVPLVLLGRRVRRRSRR